MAFDLGKIRSEVQAAPIPSPYPADLSIAIVNDSFRMAGIIPLSEEKWRLWTGRGRPNPLLVEQIGMLAHFLAMTSLREETVRALNAPPFDVEKALAGFFEAIAPLTAEMIRSNAFRQEEFLRKWIDGVGGTIEGETPKVSKKRLDQLDYRKTVTEYNRAEKARKAEAARRAKMLQEAAQREADARGWRE